MIRVGVVILMSVVWEVIELSCCKLKLLRVREE